MKRVLKPREYAIYFQWKYEPIPTIDEGYSFDYYQKYDGTEDSIIVESAAERDLAIRDMLRRDDFQYIEWCQIYANGEYGPSHIVLNERK